MSNEARGVYQKLEAALRAGDLGSVPAEIRDARGYPNVDDHYMGTPLLALALAWAPVATVEALLESGADPNYEAVDGFPAVLSIVLSDRPDRFELIDCVAVAGADVNAKGINGWTPLHAAANRDEAAMVKLLLALGADPSVRTGVDDNETPIEGAHRVHAVSAIAALEEGRPRTPD